jgi:hypothetical protein
MFAGAATYGFCGYLRLRRPLLDSRSHRQGSPTPPNFTIRFIFYFTPNRIIKHLNFFVLFLLEVLRIRNDFLPVWEPDTNQFSD